MRLATFRLAERTFAGRRDGTDVVELPAADVGALLANPDWRAIAAGSGPRHDAAGLSHAPVVPQPGKIWCVGLNYRNHILEMGRELPTHPTLFAKFAEALIGANDPIMLAPESDAVDWEGELCIVIGTAVRRADEEQAAAAIAGFTVMNDVTMRDWQYRSPMWLQGKTFEATTPLGPELVTPDELPGGVRPALDLEVRLDGEVMQKANTADLVFDPITLVRYISTITTLKPGDVIATGTPGGVGHARNPQRYLSAGQRLVTSISDLGVLENIAELDAP